MPPRKPRRPFAVFEAGAGEDPKALIKKARRSLRKRKNREFIGVDSGLNLNYLIKQKFGLTPRNLRLFEACATKVLMAIKPESQDVVFGSYIGNVLHDKGSSCAIPKLSCEKAFYVAATKALRPGGRLIMVQDKDMGIFMREVAHNLGLELHSIPIPDSKAIASDSWAMQLRSTIEKRRAYMQKYLNEEKITEKEFLSSPVSITNKIISLEDAARPTIFLLRKPKNPLSHSRTTVRILSAQELPELFQLLGQMLHEASKQK